MHVQPQTRLHRWPAITRSRTDWWTTLTTTRLRFSDSNIQSFPIVVHLRKCDWRGPVLIHVTSHISFFLCFVTRYRSRIVGADSANTQVIWPRTVTLVENLYMPWIFIKPFVKNPRRYIRPILWSSRSAARVAWERLLRRFTDNDVYCCFRAASHVVRLQRSTN